jgi:hypothetical protein
MMESIKNKPGEAPKKGKESNKDQEYDEFAALVAGLLRERKMPLSSEETEKLVLQYKAEIERLTNLMSGQELFRENEKLKLDFASVSKEMEEINKKYDMVIANNAANTGEITKLKKELDDVKLKLAKANKKLCMAGEDSIE